MHWFPVVLSLYIVVVVWFNVGTTEQSIEIFNQQGDENITAVAGELAEHNK